MTQIKIGDIEIEAYVEGSGPPLLLLAGVGAHAGTWGQPFLELVRRQFQIIRISNRGMGASTIDDAPLTIRAMADDAAAVLDALGIARADVFGYSMGGYIAQELALSHPQLVGRLVLGCTNCGPARSVQQTAADLERFNQIMAASPNDFTRGFCLAMVTNEFAKNHGAFMDDVVALHGRSSSRAFGAQMAAIHAFDSYDRVAAIAKPTFLIHGDRDIIIRHENSIMLAARIPGARMRTIANAGHMFMWERPDETLQLLTEFRSTDDRMEVREPAQPAAS